MSHIWTFDLICYAMTAMSKVCQKLSSRRK